jgi:Acetyltransferase (GNAT) domain
MHMTAASATGAAALRRVTERDDWVSLASTFDDHNFRQLWDYAAAMAARGGARAEHVCVEADGRPVGLAAVRVKPIPGLRTGIAYVSGGPLVRGAAGGEPGAALDAVVAALVREYAGRRHLVLRTAPPIGDAAWNAAQERSFLSAGFRPAVGVRRHQTMLIDIARPLDEVRAGFAKKWRYELGRAEKAGIEIAEGTDPALIQSFQPLFDEFVERKGFGVDLGADFYAALQPGLPEAERLHVALAWLDGELVAGVVATFLGDTGVYLLGASSEAGRGAQAAYLLQWRVIQAAAARGLRWYDLGGTDPDDNPGVYRFKARMGGTELEHPGPYELSPSRLRARAVRGAERLVRAARARRPH